MVKIDELSQQKKSVKLAYLRGWLYESDGATGAWYDAQGWIYSDWQRIDEWEDIIPLNLYDPANMALLARVLAWFAGITNWEPHIGMWVRWMTYARDTMLILHLHEWMCNCADYGLELAITAGLTTADEVTNV